MIKIIQFVQKYKEIFLKFCYGTEWKFPFTLYLFYFDGFPKRLILAGAVGERKTTSCADNLTMYDCMEEEEPRQVTSLVERIPCLGILLVVLGVSVFQGSSVLAKGSCQTPQ